MSFQAVCDGTLTIGTNGPECAGVWLSVQYLAPFDVTQISPSAAAEAFGAGLIVAGIPFLAVLLGRIILQQIKRGF